MAAKSCTDEEFIRLFTELGATQAAKKLGINVRRVFIRRRTLEDQLGRLIESPIGPGSVVKNAVERERRIDLKIENGSVIVGSDAHYKPEVITTAHRGLLRMVSETDDLKAVILNGDTANFPTLGKHGRIGWAKDPAVKDELQAIDERTSEIRDAAPEGCKFLMNWGNHDIRFDSFLSAGASSYEGVKGFTFQDHLPHWKFAWTIWINGDVVIKHRWKGGVHATHNNTVNAGKTIVTGHLHSLKVTPYADYNGNRFGVDTGTLADPVDEQFDYTEDNPTNWRSGFVVLTFHRGRLLWPEIVHVVDPRHIEFRGKLIRV